MTGRVDAVVVGAGCFGASVAYHLVKAGREVVLIDKAQVASQTSARGAGIATVVSRDEAFGPITRSAAERLLSIGDELDADLIVYRTGSVRLTRQPHLVDNIRREVSLGRAQNVRVRELSRSEAEELVPYLRCDEALAITYTADDVYLQEPVQLPLAFVAAGRRAGLDVHEHTPVVDIRPERDGSSTVVTTETEIRAASVVDTTGAWIRNVPWRTGVDVPVAPMRHQLAITTPLPDVRPTAPMLKVVDASTYVRPHRSALLLGVFEASPRNFPIASEPDADARDLDLDPEPLENARADIATLIPSLGDARLEEIRGGLVTMTADGRLIIDRAPEGVGPYIATGCNAGGLTISPRVGELVAEWITSGAKPSALRPFAMSRRSLSGCDGLQSWVRAVEQYRRKVELD
jgi:glycine/D-amino acid oxidase-like deaminating enzyme